MMRTCFFKSAALAWLLIVPSVCAQDDVEISGPKRHEIEQQNRQLYFQKERELDKLLASATQFPVYYQLDEELLADKHRIVMIMLFTRLISHWHVRDVTKETAGAGSKSNRFWEITAKSQPLAPCSEQEGINPAVIDPCSYDDGRPGPKTYMLVKSSTDKDLAAILKIDNVGVASLNPTDYAYPAVPKLEALTIEEATKLWGTPTKSFNYQTFDLVTTNGKHSTYHLDVEFTATWIAAYRVRGIGITNPKWITVRDIWQVPDRNGWYPPCDLEIRY